MFQTKRWHENLKIVHFDPTKLYISTPLSFFCGGLVAQAVRRSPPTPGVPSSRLGTSMWVSWWPKRGLGRFFSGFLPFSPTTNFIPPFLHTHLIHFVSFHLPLWWCDRRGRPAPLLLTDLLYRGFIASHPSTRPCVGHELRIFFLYSALLKKKKKLSLD